MRRRRCSMYQRPVLNLKRSREYTPDATRSFSYMKLFLIITAPLLPTILNAQGGIGNKPRTDIVMLSQSVRDSLSDEVFAHILDLRHYAETDQVDSAAPWIAFNGLPDKTGRWSRAINLQNPDEKARVASIFERMKRL